MDRPLSVLDVFPTPIDEYHHAASSQPSTAPRSFLLERMNRRRFSTPFLISLAMHTAVALILSVVVVHERAELLESFTADIVAPPAPKAKPRFISRRELVQPVPSVTTLRTSDAPRWSVPNVRPTVGTVSTTVTVSDDAPSRLLTTPVRDAAPSLNVPVRAVAPSFHIEQATVALPTTRIDDGAPTKPDQSLAGLSTVLLTGVEEGVSSTVSRDYLAAIRKRIERFQRYPRFARENGVEGTTTVRFILRNDGHLEELAVSSSSGSKTLDDAALAAIRDAAPFAPFPKDQRGTKLRIQLPVVFQLTSGHR
jgi:TonB family protein